MNRVKAHKIIDKLSEFDKTKSDSLLRFEAKVESLAQKIKDERDLNRLKKLLDLTPLIEEIRSVKASSENLGKDLSAEYIKALNKIESILDTYSAETDKIDQLSDKTGRVEQSVSDMGSKVTSISSKLDENILITSTITKEVKDKIEVLSKENSLVKENIEIKDKKVSKDISEMRTLIEELRVSLAINVANRGGNMNRQVLVNSVDPLKKYTDINWVAGTGITLTPVSNDTTKRVNITIDASSSGSGFQIPLSGSIGQNTFTWTTAPNVIVIDHIPYQQTSSNGEVNWTGTTTTILTLMPLSDIFSTS